MNEGWISVCEKVPDSERDNYEVTFVNECGYTEHGFAQWYDGCFHIPAIVVAWREHLEPYQTASSRRMKAVKNKTNEDSIKRISKSSGERCCCCGAEMYANIYKKKIIYVCPKCEGVVKNNPTHRIISVRKTAFWPYHELIEAKVKIVEESDHGMSPKYVYFYVNADTISKKCGISAVERWVYYYPIDDMYDPTLFVYNINDFESDMLVKKIVDLDKNECLTTEWKEISKNIYAAI